MSLPESANRPHPSSPEYQVAGQLRAWARVRWPIEQGYGLETVALATPVIASMAESRQGTVVVARGNVKQRHTVTFQRDHWVITNTQPIAGA